VDIEDGIVQDNGIGIRVDGGSTVALNSVPFSAGHSIVQRNGFGVLVRSGTFLLHGESTLQANGTAIAGEGGTIKSCCQTGSRTIVNNNIGLLLRGDHLDLRGPLTLEENRLGAIRVLGGFASVGNAFGFPDQEPAIIRNNGAPGSPAVVVVGGKLLLDRAQVTDNPSDGVVLTDNATARVLNTLISNNGGHGLRVQALSVSGLSGSLR
jgi:hypothetical protein